jgi:hypothetical protein
MTQISIGLMLRSRASSAGERVSDAPWRGVSKHGAAPILRDGRFAPSSG